MLEATRAQHCPRFTRLLALLLIAQLSLAASAFAQAAPADDQRQANLRSFDQVWTTVRDKHWDKTLGGLDWGAAWTEFRPRMEQARTVAEARAILREMLGWLRQSHFEIHPPSVYGDSVSHAAEAGRDGTCGLDVRMLEGRVVVTRVAPGSSAEAAGVRAGWCLTSINGASLVPKLKAVSARYRASTRLDRELAWVALQLLSGKPGQTVQLEFLDAQDGALTRTIPFGQRPGHKYQLPSLPPRYVFYESRLVAQQVGYITFNTWVDRPFLVRSVGDSIARFQDAKGIVIDLRGNRGGELLLAPTIAGFFANSETKSLGTLQFRDRRVVCRIHPQEQVYPGLVAILVDGATSSTSELFTCALKGWGRATVFGSPTAGAALPSVVEALPNGDTFQYAIAKLFTTDGDPIEGLGVIPDVKVIPMRSELLAGRDPALEKAIAWIGVSKSSRSQR